jgi:hypothetical protein
VRQNELPEISVDDAQRNQLAENLKKAQRDVRETVWRTYKNVMLLGKDNQVHSIDLGLVHSSSAESLVQFMINQLRQVDEIQTGISPSFLVRNWSPAFTEWSTRAIRDAFYASPVFPRLLNPESIKQTIVRGVQDGLLAYVGKGRDGRYVPFMFERSLDPSDVEISDETFILTKETALAYREAQAKPAVADLPIAVGDHPSGTPGFSEPGSSAVLPFEPPTKTKPAAGGLNLFLNFRIDALRIIVVGQNIIAESFQQFEAGIIIEVSTLDRRGPIAEMDELLFPRPFEIRDR